MNAIPGLDFNINIFYQLGFPARVDCISRPPVVIRASRDAALASFTRMFEDFIPEVEMKLAAYVDSRQTKTEDDHDRVHRHPAPWVLIHWQRQSPFA